MEECKSVDLESISSSQVKIIQKYLQAASGSAIVGMDNKDPKNNYLGVQPSHILVEGSQSKKAKKNGKNTNQQRRVELGEHII